MLFIEFKTVKNNFQMKLKEEGKKLENPKTYLYLLIKPTIYVKWHPQKTETFAGKCSKNIQGSSSKC